MDDDSCGEAAVPVVTDRGEGNAGCTKEVRAFVSTMLDANCGSGVGGESASAVSGVVSASCRARVLRNSMIFNSLRVVSSISRTPS